MEEDHNGVQIKYITDGVETDCIIRTKGRNSTISIVDMDTGKSVCCTMSWEDVLVKTHGITTNIRGTEEQWRNGMKRAWELLDETVKAGTADERTLDTEIVAAGTGIGGGDPQTASVPTNNQGGNHMTCHKCTHRGSIPERPKAWCPHKLKGDKPGDFTRRKELACPVFKHKQKHETRLAPAGVSLTQGQRGGK